MSNYVSISKDDFEFGLFSMQRELPQRRLGSIQEVQLRGVQEYVYEIDTTQPRVKIRIYSSVSKNSNQARGKGFDAIRCVVDYKGTEIFKGTAHTKRLSTWKKNLKDKILELTDRLDEMPACPQCQSAMTIRKGPRGNFWGCVSFPKCKGTKNI